MHVESRIMEMNTKVNRMVNYIDSIAEGLRNLEYDVRRSDLIAERLGYIENEVQKRSGCEDAAIGNCDDMESFKKQLMNEITIDQRICYLNSFYINLQNEYQFQNAFSTIII